MTKPAQIETEATQCLHIDGSNCGLAPLIAKTSSWPIMAENAPVAGENRGLGHPCPVRGKAREKQQDICPAFNLDVYLLTEATAIIEYARQISYVPPSLRPQS